MTDQEVTNLITEFHVPLHIQRHCAAVCDFALELGRKLVASGEKIDLVLLRHAALLHDLVRVCDFRQFNPEKFPDPISKEDIKIWEKLRKKYAGMHHAEAAAKILRERGFFDVAQIVAKHKFLQIEQGFNTWEEKLLYYADKRIEHDKVLPLRQRLEHGRKRNAPETIGQKSSQELDKKVFALEQEIYSTIGEEI